MEKNNKFIADGLRPSSIDARDFSRHTLFGSPLVSALPEDNFFVGQPLEIKDQGSTDFCAAYAASAVSEDQEGVALLPEYIFAKAKEILGDYTGYGLQLRDVCSAACKKGFLEKELNPFKNEQAQERDFYANWENWPKDLDMLAWEHAKVSYFLVDGPHDTFDNIRASLYQHRAESRSVLTGALWRPDWTMAEGGIVPKTYNTDKGFGHAFKVFGWMKIKGETYLVAQLSNGVEIGDKGLFYFPREVVNKEFIFGSYTFLDTPKEYAKYHNNIKVPLKAPIAAKIWGLIKFQISRLFK